MRAPPACRSAALCEAAVTLSDNTAANLLLATLGGPPAVTAFVRGLGDELTRLDRIEPALNEALPGDPRDTTTPFAMLRDMQRLLVGDALSAASREQLIAWLLGCKTGAKRLRAGFPQDWRVGDKTGNGGTGPPTTLPSRGHRIAGAAPILVAAYYTGSTIGGEARNASLPRLAGWRRQDWLADA